MSNPIKTQHKKRQLLEALKKSLGVVSSACAAVGVNRSTYYDYLNNDPDFRAEVEDLKNVALDFAETSLLKQIQDGNTSATIFYLKTQGKERGYVERQEVTGSDGKPVEHRIVLDKKYLESDPID